jgi:uncharacterized membrane protein YdjX (TVP38/TMEM64 family)
MGSDNKRPRFRTAWLRFGFLVLLGAVSLAVLFLSPAREYLVPERALELMDAVRSYPSAPIVTLVLFVVFGVLGAPLTPMILATGVVFGFRLGFILNYLGVVLSASATFLVGRFLGYDFIRELFGDRLARFDGFLEDRSFWPAVRLRYVPIPFPITNYGCALIGVPFGKFVAATATAYVPILLVWTYFATALLSVADGERTALLQKMTVALLAMAALTFLPPRISAWRKQRADKGQSAPKETAQADRTLGSD